MKFHAHIVLLLTILVSIHYSYALAQENNEQKIEGLTLHPNPVNTGLLFITSNHSGAKTIEIFDVLGKRRLAASILGNALDISRLTPGLYILKITQDGKSETRKLVVK